MSTEPEKEPSEEKTIPWSPGLFPTENQGMTDSEGYDLPDGRSVYFGQLDSPGKGFGLCFMQPIPGKEEKAMLKFALTPESAYALMLLITKNISAIVLQAANGENGGDE